MPVDQRYYSSIMGRFLTPDPYKAGKGSGDPANPQSWNRYAYASSDPVNFYDPRGENTIEAGGFCTVGAGEGAQTVPCSIFSTTFPEMHTVAEYDDTYGKNTVQPAWKKVAVGGLRTIASGGFASKSKCRDFFTALAGGDAVSGSELMAQAAVTAADAADNGYVYDGPSSKTKLGDDSFPGAGSGTVGSWFTANPGAEALSQYNGSAIFIKSDDWGGIFSPYGYGSANSYGLGTLLHEILHKASVGGGFEHYPGAPEMENALKSIGAYSQGMGQNAISLSLGNICF